MTKGGFFFYLQRQHLKMVDETMIYQKLHLEIDADTNFAALQQVIEAKGDSKRDLHNSDITRHRLKKLKSLIKILYLSTLDQHADVQ